MRKVAQRYLRDMRDEFEDLWGESSLEDAELVLFLEGRLEGPSRGVNPTSCFSEIESGSVFSTSTFDVPEKSTSLHISSYFVLLDIYLII